MKQASNGFPTAPFPPRHVSREAEAVWSRIQSPCKPSPWQPLTEELLPEIFPFITLLNPLSLHLITMSPDLWPPFYVITFFKQAVKIELPDFYLPPHYGNWFKKAKILSYLSLICPSSPTDVSDVPLSAQPIIQLFLHVISFLFFLSTFLSFSLSSILRKDYVKTGKLIKMQ